eukprot:m.55529 g.55529  ORF g.55529 m.55529 type:complete len:198 (+) comp18642_c0_seq2:71-664(+)
MGLRCSYVRAMVLVISCCVVAMVFRLPSAEENQPPQDETFAVPWPGRVILRTHGNRTACRSTVQGAWKVADDQGFICDRRSLLATGCCPKEPGLPNQAAPSQYDCNSCRSDKCCTVYENCVVCCLNPENEPMLTNFLTKTMRNFETLFRTAADQFDLCRAKCRTNSLSVQHENKFRDRTGKYCYGPETAAVIPSQLK